MPVGSKAPILEHTHLDTQGVYLIYLMPRDWFFWTNTLASLMFLRVYITIFWGHLLQLDHHNGYINWAKYPQKSLGYWITITCSYHLIVTPITTCWTDAYVNPSNPTQSRLGSLMPHWRWALVVTTWPNGSTKKPGLFESIGCPFTNKKLGFNRN